MIKLLYSIPVFLILLVTLSSPTVVHSRSIQIEKDYIEQIRPSGTFEIAPVWNPCSRVSLVNPVYVFQWYDMPEQDLDCAYAHAHLIDKWHITKEDVLDAINDTSKAYIVWRSPQEKLRYIRMLSHILLYVE